MKKRLWLYVLFPIICLGLLVSNPVRSAAQPSFVEEHARYVSKDSETKEIKDYLEIRIEKKGDQYHWFEKRELINGDLDTFNVNFDINTLIPTSYVREMKTGDTKKAVKLSVTQKNITAEITDGDGKVVTQSIDLPGEAFVIEPFLKKYISSQAGKGLKSGSCLMITLVQGKLKSFSIGWEVEEQEKITTKAGTFDCFKIKAGPSGWFMKKMVPPSITWYDASGTHKMIQNKGKRTRFDKEKIMELTEYSLK